MDNVTLGAELLKALDSFDERTAPLGLYACEEFQTKGHPYPRLQQEWKNCFTPTLQRLGCRPRRANLSDGEFDFDLPDGAPARLNLVRTSKIKVRKFGNTYRLDPHRRYDERWRELRLDRLLGSIRKASGDMDEEASVFRLCLFIGFAVEAVPFQKELEQLHDRQRWEERGLDYQSCWWTDRYERHFSVRLSVWSAFRQL